MSILNINRIKEGKLQEHPYKWSFVHNLFCESDSVLLYTNYPTDNFKALKDYNPDKSFYYQSRSMVHMGVSEVTFPEKLHPIWIKLMKDFISNEYRQAVSDLIGIDVTQSKMEANIFHYGSNNWMGAHTDLKEKIVTHVIYFNETWTAEYGGCLSVLGSKNEEDIIAKTLPLIGNSIFIVRSENSWHSVDLVRNTNESRKCMTVTFYKDDAISTMWPPGQIPVLNDFNNNL